MEVPKARSAKQKTSKDVYDVADKPLIRKTYSNVTSTLRGAAVFAFFFFGILSFYNGPGLALLPETNQDAGLWILCAGTASAAVTSFIISLVPQTLEKHLIRMFGLGGCLLIPMLVNAVCQQLGMVPVSASLICSTISWMLFGVAISVIISACASYLYCTSFDSITLIIGIGACVGTILFAFLVLLQNRFVCIAAAAVIYFAGCAAAIYLASNVRQDEEKIQRKHMESRMQRGSMSPVAVFSTFIQVVILGYLVASPAQNLFISASQIFFIGCLIAAFLFVFTYAKLKWVSDLQGICLLTMPVIMAGLVLSRELGIVGIVVCNGLIVIALSYHYFVYWQDSICISRNSVLEQYSYHARSHSAVFASALFGMLLHTLVVSNSATWGSEAESIASSVLVVALCVAFLMFAISDQSFYESAHRMMKKMGTANMCASPSLFEDETIFCTDEGAETDMAEATVLDASTDRIDARCVELIERFALTDREAEVLVLLAKGRNAEYIMGELSISRSTAKSHIASVYRKVGIHRQQELITFVDGDE